MAAEGTEISLLFLIRTLEGSHFNNLHSTHISTLFLNGISLLLFRISCAVMQCHVQNILSGICYFEGFTDPVSGWRYASF